MFRVGVNWRTAYIISIALRVVLALSDLYIHPDEHFQSLEVMAGRILGWSCNPPWEFALPPARSLVPLYILYAPVLYLIRTFNPHIVPRNLWYTMRLQNTILGWLITDSAIYALLPKKPERVKAIFFALTSYITLVHQSHLFSNSCETWLVLVCLGLINRLRAQLEKSQPASPQHLYTALLGALLVIGTFNRVTFPVFLAIPAWYVAKHLYTHKAACVSLTVSVAVCSVIMIVADLVLFNGRLLLSELVVAPWNNLRYNSDRANLALHGIHPFYTHLVVNLPQILGPAGVILLLWRFRNRYWRSLPFQSSLGALLLLSAIPHQEMRFLMPIVPLLCCCFDLSSLSAHSDGKVTKKKGSRGTALKWIAPLCIVGWLSFNTIMAVFTGTIHQAGIVPALEYIRDQVLSPLSLPSVQIWWRTYPPPAYMLGALPADFAVIPLPLESMSTPHVLIDAMGSATIETIILKARTDFSERNIYLITPMASFATVIEKQGHTFERVWSTKYHMDMDHLDWSDRTSFSPGLGIYRLVSPQLKK